MVPSIRGYSAPIDSIVTAVDLDLSEIFTIGGSYMVKVLVIGIAFSNDATGIVSKIGLYPGSESDAPGWIQESIVPIQCNRIATVKMIGKVGNTVGISGEVGIGNIEGIGPRAIVEPISRPEIHIDNLGIVRAIREP